MKKIKFLDGCGIGFSCLLISLNTGIVLGNGTEQGVVSMYGFDFAYIGDPGNRDTMPFETPLVDSYIGGVEYEYRLATTEVTVGQYIEFVKMYYPYYVQKTGDQIGQIDFVGSFISASPGNIHVKPGCTADQPTDLGWEYAARYANWLHHGKVNEDWAFETGPYDTSTFVRDSDGYWLHQASRNPDSRFWIPSVDEWTKAGYWDPNKDEGEGGFWQYPNGTDTESRPGLPIEGGERNAGNTDDFPLGVGSFTQVKSPWGMYDMAGGQPEYTETVGINGFLHNRLACGSEYLDDSYGNNWITDILAFNMGTVVRNIFFGDVDYRRLGLRLGAQSGFHPADLDEDDRVDFFDISLFVDRFINGDERVDFRADGVLNADDVRVFLGLMGLE